MTGTFLRKLDAWLFDELHTRVAGRYLVGTLCFFFLGGLLALLMRWKLAWPNVSIPLAQSLLGWPDGVMPPEFYAQAFTMHGTVMIWLVVIPALAWGFGFLAIPRLVNRQDLAMPRTAAVSFWWLVAGGAVLLVGWAGSGWTAYAPLGTLTTSAWVPYKPDAASWLRLWTRIDGFPMQRPWPLGAIYGCAIALALLACSILRAVPLRSRMGRWVLAGVAVALGCGMTLLAQLIVFDGQTAWFLAVGWWAIGSLLAAIPLLSTILLSQLPRRSRLPLEVWGWAATAGVALFAGPVLVLAMVLNLLDAHGLTNLFAANAGTPLLHQHLFWFYGHPAVYLMILPAFGLVTDTLAEHSSRPVYGYWMMVGTTIAISTLGFLVWAHHMFQSGLDPQAGLVFSAATLLIAVPSALKVVGWLGMIVGGRLQLTASMWAALAFVSLFVLGGLSGVVMAAPALNLHLHDTYFVVAHLHYTLFGGSVFGLFLATYRWLPVITGQPLNETLAKWHLLLSYIAFNCTFGAMHLLGMHGMPRRYADPSSIGLFERFAGWQQFMTVWAAVLGLAQLLLLLNVILSRRNGCGRLPQPGFGS